MLNWGEIDLRTSCPFPLADIASARTFVEREQNAMNDPEQHRTTATRLPVILRSAFVAVIASAVIAAVGYQQRRISQLSGQLDQLMNDHQTLLRSHEDLKSYLRDPRVRIEPLAANGKLGPMRPLGRDLKVDARGLIWDGGINVGVWGVNGPRGVH